MLQFRIQVTKLRSELSRAETNNELRRTGVNVRGDETWSWGPQADSLGSQVNSREQKPTTTYEVPTRNKGSGVAKQ